MSLAAPPHYVGPYRLDKTLGKGQTGMTRRNLLVFSVYIVQLKRAKMFFLMR